MPSAKPHRPAQQAPNRTVPEELRKEADTAAALAKALRSHSIPLHSHLEEQLAHPDMAEALNAQKWLWPRNRDDMGPIRGIDY
eukprot:724489-Heterocapsa_arctica.AAC.1